jgi:hypothetical protein
MAQVEEGDNLLNAMFSDVPLSRLRLRSLFRSLNVRMRVNHHASSRVAATTNGSNDARHRGLRFNKGV